MDSSVPGPFPGPFAATLKVLSQIVGESGNVGSQLDCLDVLIVREGEDIFQCSGQRQPAQQVENGCLQKADGTYVRDAIPEKITNSGESSGTKSSTSIGWVGRPAAEAPERMVARIGTSRRSSFTTTS